VAVIIAPDLTIITIVDSRMNYLKERGNDTIYASVGQSDLAFALYFIICSFTLTNITLNSIIGSGQDFTRSF
jgi:hypothetical protein